MFIITYGRAIGPFKVVLTVQVKEANVQIALSHASTHFGKMKRKNEPIITNLYDEVIYYNYYYTLMSCCREMFHY